MIRMVPALVFAAVATLLCVALLLAPKPDSFNGPMSDQNLPKLPLQTAKQEDAAISTGKVTVINFLASWCAPCAAEMGELQTLKTALPNVQFAGIAWNDSPGNMGPWLKKHGNPFDTLVYDPKGRAAIAMGLRGIPETFVVDAQGVVRYQVAGALTESSRSKLLPLIAQLEAEDAR